MSTATYSCSLFRIAATLLLTGCQLLRFQAEAAESADELLRASQKTLLSASSFSVEYSSEMRDGGGSQWLGFKGWLAFEKEDHYCLTNMGGIFLVLTAHRTFISNGKNFLDVAYEAENEHALPQCGVVEWYTNSPGPLSKTSCVNRIVHQGLTYLVSALVEDSTIGILPEMESMRFQAYPASLSLAFSTTNAELLPDERLSGKIARHVKYAIERGTNGLETVDLWLDQKSLLPVKRVSTPPHFGAVTETCQFTLNPKLSPALFEPKTLIKREKIERQIAEAQMPDSRLLKAVLKRNRALVEQALKSGANPNGRSAKLRVSNLTPLMLAAMSGNLGLTELLVDAGASLNDTSRDGRTALDLAQALSNTNIVNYLIEHGGNGKGNR